MVAKMNWKLLVFVVLLVGLIFVTFSFVQQPKADVNKFVDINKGEQVFTVSDMNFFSSSGAFYFPKYDVNSFVEDSCRNINHVGGYYCSSLEDLKESFDSVASDDWNKPCNRDMNFCFIMHKRTLCIFDGNEKSCYYISSVGGG